MTLLFRYLYCTNHGAGNFGGRPTAERGSANVNHCGMASLHLLPRPRSTLLAVSRNGESSHTTLDSQFRALVTPSACVSSTRNRSGREAIPRVQTRTSPRSDSQGHPYELSSHLGRSLSTSLWHFPHYLRSLIIRRLVLWRMRLKPKAGKTSFGKRQHAAPAAVTWLQYRHNSEHLRPRVFVARGPEPCVRG